MLGPLVLGGVFFFWRVAVHCIPVCCDVPYLIKGTGLIDLVEVSRLGHTQPIRMMASLGFHLQRDKKQAASRLLSFLGNPG
jgi:hypothetical protein